MKKGSKMTAEQRKNVSRGVKKAMSDPELRKKLSIIAKRTPNKGRYTKGHKLSKESLIKMSEGNKKKWADSEYKKMMLETNKGLFKKGEHNNPRHEFKKGQVSPNLGKKASEESKMKMSLAKLGKKASEETKLKISEANRGEKAHTWRGGKSFEPYTSEFNTALKKRIRQRDNYTCQLCGKKETSRKLSVHHIDYDKLNCDPKNLISLCASCHSKTSHKREEWIIIFKNIREMKK